MKTLFLAFALLLSPFVLFAQADTLSGLYRALKSNDSLLFNIGYNTCDIKPFEELLSDNFEFYHDEAGLTNSKAVFIAGIKNGLCKLDYKPRRVLVENSLQVYPLEKNGVLYGAVQTGIHQFYALEKGKT